MAGKQTSAEKRYAQSEVRRLHNKAIKSTCKTYAKQFIEAVHAKDQKLAEEKYKTLQKELEIEKMENYPTEKRYDNLSKEDRELGFDFVNPP